MIILIENATSAKSGFWFAVLFGFSTACGPSSLEAPNEGETQLAESVENPGEEGDLGTDDSFFSVPDSVEDERAFSTASGEVTDSDAQTTRTIPAYKSPTDPSRLIPVFEVKFLAQPGERRLISARINAQQNDSTPDVLLMAAVSLSCNYSSAPTSSAGATENTLRGRTTVLTPRFIYTYRESTAHTVTCRLSATGRRPRPVSGTSSRNVWVVDTGSSLTASAPVGPMSRTLVSGARSRVLDRGESWTPIFESFHVDAGLSSFQLISDHKVTTCSSVGGSSDATGTDMCAGRVSRSGTDIRLTVKARQRTNSGDWCGEPQVIESIVTRVTPDIHHQMLFNSGTVKVNPACSTAFVVTGTLENDSGADIVIHAGSERTLVVTP